MAQNLSQQILIVLDKLKIENPRLLGKGGEGFIFDYSRNKVLKIYPRANKNYLQKLAVLQKLIYSYKLSFDTPEILDIGEVNNTQYTIEKRLSGKALDIVFPHLNKDKQYELLGKYIDAMYSFNSIELYSYSYGQILQIDDAITASDWQEFILQKLSQRVKRSQKWLEKDVQDFKSKLNFLQDIIQREIRCSHKNLVHCDYYFNNVLVSDDLTISAVLDFSLHAVVGDKRLDAASVKFLTLDKHITDNHLEFVTNFIKTKYGEDVIKYLDIYGIYYAIYYADTFEFDPHSYKWCLSILNDDNIWRKLGNS